MFVGALALLVEFSRTTPLLVVMLHYTVIALFFSGACGEISMPAFFVYFAVMSALAAAWGFAVHWVIRVGSGHGRARRVQRVAFCVWNGVVSAFCFAAWAIIRAKPFKCLEGGEVLTYTFAPPVFWVIQLVALISNATFIMWFSREHPGAFFDQLDDEELGHDERAPPRSDDDDDDDDDSDSDSDSDSGGSRAGE